MWCACLILAQPYEPTAKEEPVSQTSETSVATSPVEYSTRDNQRGTNLVYTMTRMDWMNTLQTQKNSHQMNDLSSPSNNNNLPSSSCT